MSVHSSYGTVEDILHMYSCCVDLSIQGYNRANIAIFADESHGHRLSVHLNLKNCLCTKSH